MLDKLKMDFDGILELVNKCPAPLQETALKMILERWFSANVAPPASPAKPDLAAKGAAAGSSQTGVPDAVKPFLTANAITTDILDKAFHPTGPGAQLLASEISGSGKANQLVNLGILLCAIVSVLLNAFFNGLSGGAAAEANAASIASTAQHV